MTSAKILAIIQAGGAGGRMDVLTTERPKPVLRFGGSYRLIDFVLSNLMHSRLDDVWLSVSYQGASVVERSETGGRGTSIAPTAGCASLDRRRASARMSRA